MKKILLSTILLLLFLLQSCTTKKQILYLQDIDKYSNIALNYATTQIQPNDILKIDIGDLNPLVAAPFNNNAGNSTTGASVETLKITGYLVTPQGTISLPILNEISAVGLTTMDLEKKIKNRLINEGYLVNPTVLVRVINNKFTILGEVNSPGVKPFTEGSISLLDAIAMSGDLTNTAIRKDVKLIRETDGKRIVYHVDLTTASWMSNPNYRIRQNDVIVVTPNKVKVNSGGLIKDPIQFIGTVLSFATILLIIRNN
jgi:polysaccharide biosynthesis/export protein